MSGLTMTRTAYLHAPIEEVWRSLTDPRMTVQYVGRRVQSTWRPGDEVVYLAPDTDQRLFEGHLLEVEPLRRLVLRCRWLFSPELAADKPHRETFELEPLGHVTRWTATFDEYEDGSPTYDACDMARTGDALKTPGPDGLRQRLQEVLGVLYLMFNAGYLSTGGDRATRPDLAQDAAWLAGLLVGWLPDEPEPKGLLALMRLHLARSASRFSSNGELVLLKDQNRALWDRDMIFQAKSLLDAAAKAGRLGAYQLQAAIVACHAETSSYEATDWARVVALYDHLLELAPSPVVRLNRAVAVRELAGPAAAVREIEPLAEALDGYYLFHAVRAELLRATGQLRLARAEQLRALALTDNVAERVLLERRIRDA